MSKFLGRKPASQPVFTRLFDWSRANLYLSLANGLAVLIAAGTTMDIVENFIHANQLELGVLALPFIACLDILFIALVASLFVRRPPLCLTYCVACQGLTIFPMQQQAD